MSADQKNEDPSIVLARIDERQKQLLRTVTRLESALDGIAEIAPRLTKVESKVAALHTIIAGNGKPDQSVMIKLDRVIESAASHTETLEEHEERLDALQHVEIAWRNRLVGVVAFLGVVNALLVLYAFFFR